LPNTSASEGKVNMHKQVSRSKPAGRSKRTQRAHARSVPVSDTPLRAERVVREQRPMPLDEADWVLDESTTWPVDEEAHPRPASRTSGTLSADLEGERLPVVDPGISIDPEDLGRQFLRDATDQDNFESSAEADELDPGSSSLEPLVSEASLEASAQAGFALPQSSALNASGRRLRSQEPRSRVVDLMSNVVRDASLFDQPNERGDLRTPVIFADEQGQHLAQPAEEAGEPRRRR
jgi:hypothetical protein